MHRRIYTLLIPYLFWNALFIGLYYIAECIPPIRDVFNDGKKLVHDFSIADFLGAFGVNKGPLVDQLWFVRNLMLLVIASPIIYQFIRYTRIVGVIILGLFWYFGTDMAYPQSSVFYFSLGAYFSINEQSMIEEIHKISKWLFIFFPILIVADALTAGTLTGYYLHRTQTFVGTLFVLALIPTLVEKGEIRDIAFLSSASFFLYVAHDPMLRFMRRFSLKLTDPSSDFQALAAYFLCIGIDIAIVYVVYWILQKYAPTVLKWTTGRG